MSIYHLDSSGEENEEYHNWLTYDGTIYSVTSDEGYCTDDAENRFANLRPYNDTSSAIDTLIDDFARLHICDVDNVLTVKEMDFLAASLGSKWKRFARMTGLMGENDLSCIDEDFRLLYEKSYQMIQLWQAKSRDALTVSMAASILMSIDRNTLARDLKRFDAPLEHSLLAHDQVHHLCKTISSNWKNVARVSGFFTYIEIQNIDEEERNQYERCYRMIIEWQEKSLVMLTLDEIEAQVSKAYKELSEVVVAYTIDSSKELQKVKVRADHCLQDLKRELSSSIQKTNTCCKVQYVDNNGARITCNTDKQLDLAIFSEGVKMFHVLIEEVNSQSLLKHSYC